MYACSFCRNSKPKGRRAPWRTVRTEGGRVYGCVNAAMARRRSSVMWQLPRTFVLALCLAVCGGAGAEAGIANQLQARILPEDVPDFSADASRITIESVQSGDWSNPSTWQGAQVPTA